MTARITIPPQVQALLRQLNAAGFSAYAVGGCVRDSLLGCAPQDWDICTSAAPEQTEVCFAADRTILTGARYGTVTVVRGGVPYEITTFRAEAGYADSRHPDRVDFLRELAPEVIIVVAYGKLLPKAVLDIPPHGCINVHGSLLPRWRGAAPIQW